jgi:large subunit ribosomal protein L14
MRVGTVVKVADNSGPCFLRIIKILRNSPQNQAKTGDHVIGSVLRTHERKKFKVNKGSIVRAIVLRCADPFKRKDGQRLRFQYPAVTIITKSGLPRGTKIFGPIPKELRELGYIRIVSLSTIAL